MIQNPVILFDGVCKLCNGTVDFILKRDRKKQFRFVALQLEAGEAMKDHFGVPEKIDSVILIHQGMVFYESEAVLKIAQILPFPWRLAVVLKIIPLKIRNRLYRWIALNRYRWFGKKPACRIPTSEEIQFFPNIRELKL